MVKIKIVFCLVVLVFSLFYPIELSLAAYPAESQSPFGTWEPPKNFVDPVTQKIQAFKANGLSDEQITKELAALGMGWYPETGATWMGRSLTSEELAEIPDQAGKPVETPRNDTSSAEDFITQTTSPSRLVYIGRTACMRTTYSYFAGVASQITCGSLNYDLDGTRLNYLCVQLGTLSGTQNWVETVLTHDVGDGGDYEWHTYDNDEGGWAYYMDKNTGTGYADTYVILLDGTSDDDGWHYNVWINNQWVRNGHLSSQQVQAGLQKEAYSTSGSFTDDVSSAIFYQNWLHFPTGDWINWVYTYPYYQLLTTWTTASPVRESHVYGAAGCYLWETWTQN